ncbi:hypothetical protein, partial [Domibacillus tundrae]|uniref:hypothetical protein n=1 Tax=Domibacillus tundrae TaxID=1587527 RepID=UPI00339736C7
RNSGGGLAAKTPARETRSREPAAFRLPSESHKPPSPKNKDEEKKSNVLTKEGFICSCPKKDSFF